MRIKEGYSLRRLGDEYVISTEKLGCVDFNRLMVLNASAAYLWEQVAGHDFDERQLAELLQSEYGIDAATAAGDASKIVALWRQHGIVEE